MSVDVTVKIGGSAGQGIQTVGGLLAEVAKRAGFYIMAINDFESRIRGGHSYFQIRISDQPVMAPHHKTHLLVGLTQDTFVLHSDTLEENGIVLVEKAEEENKRTTIVPVTELAMEAGGKVMTNTVAAGAILSLLGSPFHHLKEVLEKRFSSKSEQIVTNNIKAAELGFKAVEGKSFHFSFDWNIDQEQKVLVNGSKAVSLGAVAADCRFASFYPMSPATSIISELVPLTKDFPLVIEQAEDEIAAVNMILGASYAGVRSMTSTSGGGFCLMVEGLGLAGITETPIVIVNSQRPGPATGLPTRTAQADLQFVIHASQDEFPRFVFAPGTASEAFEKTVLAFHLAEKYQVPSIILTDQYFNDSLFIAERPFEAPAAIERFLITDEDLNDPETYKRYQLTESGISPRAVPCQGKALVMASGNEHTEDGHLSEDQQNRVKMFEKRASKIPAMTSEMQAPEGFEEDAEVLLVGWGSSKGAVFEAASILREQGLNVGSLHFTDLWPFPAEKVRSRLEKVRKFIMVELNGSAQLGSLIREQTGLGHSGAILKYDGRPFFPNEIAEQARDLME